MLYYLINDQDKISQTGTLSNHMNTQASTRLKQFLEKLTDQCFKISL